MVKKIVVIFGGNGSLGKKLSNKFYESNCCVISVDKNNKSFEKIKQNFYTAKADVTNQKSLKNLRSKVIKNFGKVDIIVYSVTYKSKDFYYSFNKLSLSSWRKIIDIELTGAFLVSQIFGNIFEKQNKGNIIFLSSIYGIVGNDHSIYKGSNLAQIYSNKNQKKNIYSNSAYSTAKGGLISFVKFLSTYWAGKNIRVNSCSPGGIFNKFENKKFIKNYSSKVPLRRKAEINEIVNAVMFLASEKSSYINGHNLVVDGGFTAW
tara:strand:+ start:1091 stop:1876 length:786 start_codon:yes stop_codon:yes gene_type:complete